MMVIKLTFEQAMYVSVFDEPDLIAIALYDKTIFLSLDRIPINTPVAKQKALPTQVGLSMAQEALQ